MAEDVSVTAVGPMGQNGRALNSLKGAMSTYRGVATVLILLLIVFGIPRVGPFALYGLLFTIVVLFALQGKAITSNPLDVARIALPLLAYFAVMWGGGYALGASLGLGYERTTTLAFTAAGNNFELAIAVAIATFGVTSGQALAGVVGPLIEVPVLVGLVYVSLALRKRFTPQSQLTST